MPIGPEVVTPDEADVTDVALTTVLNGQVMQDARTSQMLVDVPSAVELFSSFTTLRPGNVIATGTPGGVGFARKPQSGSSPEMSSRSPSRASEPSATAWSPNRATAPAGDGGPAPLPASRWR